MKIQGRGERVSTFNLHFMAWRKVNGVQGFVGNKLEGLEMESIEGGRGRWKYEMEIVSVKMSSVGCVRVYINEGQNGNPTICVHTHVPHFHKISIGYLKFRNHQLHLK